ncbi:MAG TPA: hypothetical protein VE999_06815 [Gemmataceae bacterium]|nr:hypothetical protein [Gemmataceae bacterium]
MNVTPTPVLTVAELQRLLAQTEPGALLVPSRILRRVIKMDRGLAGPGLQVPHRKSYVVARERLLRIAGADELELEPGRELPPIPLLFPRPDRQRLAERDRATTLLKYWRLLFHARIHVAFQQARSASNGTQDKLRSRIQRIGLTEFDEATAVLRQESYLLPPGDAAAAYEEFAAVYLELRYFAPNMLPLYFPACSCLDTIDSVLAQDVDAAGLFAATRLEGTPNPAPPSIPSLADEKETLARSAGDESEATPLLALGMGDVGDAPRAYRRLLERAEKASRRGNMVRAAIFRMRAVTLAPSGQANPTRAAAQREMEQFSRRLQKAIDYPNDVAADWRQALFALLEPASRGIWPSESRLLYDLQKACIDRERPVYAVDLIEWFVSWGRRPIKRLLPFHDSVRVVKHLRSALHRLTAIRIDEPIRRRLIELLIESTHHAEHHLRERLRPVLRDALNKVGLTPRNIAEETARDKVVEELIDLVVEHGFLGMSDLRDAIARNRLKLPDLTGIEASGVALAPRETAGTLGALTQPRSPLRYGLAKIAVGFRTFFLGDQLIRANRQLATDLDGVYRRGEIYLRWLQRFSAAAFGTHIGRLFTLYLALPFGCSLALLKVWDEIVEHLPGGPKEGSEAAREAAKHINPYAFTLLGLFFLALFHIGPFRRALLWASVKIWHGLRCCFHDLPAWFLRLPWVVRILQSEPWLFFYQFVFKPLPWAALGALGANYFGGNNSVSLAVGAAFFVAGVLVLNSRWGTYLEETAADNLMRTWQLIHADLVPGLVRWVIYLYRRLQEEVERLIYTVDEWLRFRPGDSQLSLVAKPVLGLIWFGVTYIFRVIFNLFVEPTFNPIKHFPTVTVAAKLLLPIDPVLLHMFRAQLEPVLGKALGNSVALAALGLLPGFAGFLVWEFKENWRLYRANQSPTLRPEIVGHHGETVLRLMRPGFHSGTLPKLYARLRHGRGRSPRKQYEALHHLRERLRHFVERNLFAILAGSKSWGDAVRLRVGEIRIATNRIRIELCDAASSVHVDFEAHGGWLLAGLSCPAACPKAWLTHLGSEQGMAFRDALGGFYKQAGVDAVREQIASRLPPGAVYDLTEKSLVVWPLPGRSGETVYDLEDDAQKEAWLYSATPIRWEDWVDTWQHDHDGKGHAPLVPLRVRLLLGIEGTERCAP